MATYYVSSGTGKDSNGGTSLSSAFATLQQAANVVRPGDTVEVEGGTYTHSGSGNYVVNLTRSGTASAPITFEAAPGQKPVIDTTNQWVGIEDTGASYLTISGFTITGDANSVTQGQAQAQANNTNDPTTSGTGIGIKPSGNTHPTHVTIQNNTVEDQPGGGIQVTGGDYISILNNTVADNTKWSPFSNSGISVFESYSSDFSTGTKITIAGNTVYGNQNEIPWHTTGKITDGEGIIVDSNNLTNYDGKVLVENNVAYDNGSSGILAYDSNNVAMLYNTAYQNNQSSNLNNGEIRGNAGTGITIENNIMDASTGKSASIVSSGVAEDYNLLYGGNGSKAQGPHDITGNPMFVAPSNDNFQLQANSPAIGRANLAFLAATDIVGNPRSASTGYDLGAYQHTGTGSSQDTLTLYLSEDYWQGNAQFDLSVNGTQVAANDPVTTLASSGTYEPFTFTGNWRAVSQVTVSFVNDAYGGTSTNDRNLYLSGIAYNGTSSDDTATFYTNGTHSFTVA